MLKLRLSRKQIPYLILVVFGILLFAIGILNHYYFRTFTFDYGNYNYAFWDYSHFRISRMPTYPANFLQDHFSLTLMYFVPAYWILNWITGTYTLILIQNALILTAAWFTYKLILLKSDNVWMSIGVLIYYFTLLGRYTTFSCDANIAVMSACFIPIFIYYFEIRKYLAAFIILILSLLSRENIPLWFIFIFIVLMINHHKDKKAVLLSLAGIAISIIYFILLFKVFIPSVETPEKQFSLFNYSALGANPGKALLFVISHPIETIKLFFINHLNDPAYDWVKSEFYLVYLISGGFVLFLRPKYLIWFIPIVAQKVLNDGYIRWGIATYYSIEVVTLLPLSVFAALSSIKQRRVQNGLIIIVTVATVATTIYKLDEKHYVLPWTLSPEKVKFFDKQFLTSPLPISKINETLALIPSNAKVSASDHLFPHLSQRQSINLFPTVNDAEYVVFSVYDDYFLISHRDNEESRNTYFSDPQWELVSKEFPVFLFKRTNQIPYSTPPTEKGIWLATDTMKCNYENIDLAKRHAIFDNQEMAETIENISTEKAYSGNHSMMLSPTNPYGSAIKINDLNKVSYLQISAWSYSKKNQLNIVAGSGKNFYLLSDEEAPTASGWKKIFLDFWVPKNLDASTISIYFWNSSSDSVYYDDLQIIKKYID